MKRAIRKIRQRIFCYLEVLLAAAALSGLSGLEAFAAQEPGIYTVTVTPAYRDPVTGDIEDPGNNEGIGQGMTENLCGSTGLLEVEEDGTAYLTVRYYLDQFIGDVTFEERTSGSSSWSSLSYTKMQTKSGNSSAADIHEKYGCTDYRMRITDITSTFRGGAYVEPMGRSVVYFFQASNPMKGSGDFIVSVETGTTARETEAMQEDSREAVLEEEPVYEKEPEALPEKAPADEGLISGSGNADDPVTGIPKKPRAGGSNPAAGEIGDENPNAAASYDVEYHLETTYDLSSVSLKEARRLTEPMLENAVGITGMTGELEYKDAVSEQGEETSLNQRLMQVLLAVSAVLLVWFGYGTVSRKKAETRASVQTKAPEDEIKRMKKREKMRNEEE